MRGIEIQKPASSSSVAAAAAAAWVMIVDDDDDNDDDGSWQMTPRRTAGNVPNDRALVRIAQSSLQQLVPRVDGRRPPAVTMVAARVLDLCGRSVDTGNVPHRFCTRSR